MIFAIASRARHLFLWTGLAAIALAAGCGDDTGTQDGSVYVPGNGASGDAGNAAKDGGASNDDGATSAPGDDAGGQGGQGDDDGGNAPGEAGGGDRGDGGLDPSRPPGGNFDLSLWELQEPVGSPGAPTTILPAQLVGATGYHDTYFFTDPTDGSMTFWDPEDGVKTANSNYPRSELREMTASGAPANWMTAGHHTLSATLKVTEVPDHVAVGQIHLGTGTPSSTKPLLELFYYKDGKIEMSIEQSPAGGSSVPHPVGTVPLGEKWSYVIGLSGNTISLVVNGGAAQTWPMSSTFNQEGMYFKAGDYDQTAGSDHSIGAKVQLYALATSHGP